MCTLFAATHPDMTAALVMIGSYARRLWAPDYPWGPTAEERDRFCQTIIEQWGGPVGIEERAPSRALDPEFRSWWSAYLRMGASPGAAVALTRMNAEVDIRDVLPKIRVPDARHSPHGRSVLEDRRRALPGRTHSRARRWWSYRATIICPLLAIKSRCCRRSISFLQRFQGFHRFQGFQRFGSDGFRVLGTFD